MVIENYMPDFAVEAVYDSRKPAKTGNKSCFGGFR